MKIEMKMNENENEMSYYFQLLIPWCKRKEKKRKYNKRKEEEKKDHNCPGSTIAQLHHLVTLSEILKGEFSIKFGSTVKITEDKVDLVNT